MVTGHITDDDTTLILCQSYKIKSFRYKGGKGYPQNNIDMA